MGCTLGLRYGAKVTTDTSLVLDCSKMKVIYPPYYAVPVANPEVVGDWRLGTRIILVPLKGTFVGAVAKWADLA